MEMARHVINGKEEMLAVAVEIGEECGNVAGERCDQAYSFETCLENAVKTRGDIDFQMF